MQTRSKPVRGQPPHPLLNKAQQFIKDKDFDEANKIFDQIVRDDPKSIAAHMGLGIINLRLGKYDEADSNFNDVIKVNDKSARAWSMKASVSVKRDNPDKAIEQHENALEADPKYNRSRVSLGTLYAKKEDYTNAEIYLRDALRYNPQYSHANMLLARVLHLQGRTDEAEERMKNALLRQANSAESYSFVGRFYLSIEDYQSAREALVQSTDLDASNAMAFVNLSSALTGMEQHAEAIIALKDALNLEPDNRERVEIQLAKSFVENNDLEEARKLLKQLCMGEILLGRAHLMLAEIHALKEEYPEALEEYEAALLLADALVEKSPDLAKIKDLAIDDKAKVEAFQQAITRMADEFATAALWEDDTADDTSASK